MVNKSKIFEYHRIGKFSNNIDLRKQVFLSAECFFAIFPFLGVSSSFSTLHFDLTSMKATASYSSFNYIFQVDNYLKNLFIHLKI